MLTKATSPDLDSFKAPCPIDWYLIYDGHPKFAYYVSSMLADHSESALSRRQDHPRTGLTDVVVGADQARAAKPCLPM